MLAIKKSGGVTGIERERFKAFKRSKRSPCPFPTISNEIEDSKCTRRKAAHRQRIPGPAVEVTSRHLPGLTAIYRTKRGALVLRLRGQYLAVPSGVRRRFR